MQERRLDARRLDEQRLEGDDQRRPFGAVGLAPSCSTLSSPCARRGASAGSSSPWLELMTSEALLITPSQ